MWGCDTFVIHVERFNPDTYNIVAGTYSLYHRSTSVIKVVEYIINVTSNV